MSSEQEPQDRGCQSIERAALVALSVLFFLAGNPDPVPNCFSKQKDRQRPRRRAEKPSLRFVEEVKAQCADMDAQWEERQKTRASESSAISKAVEILDAEEAHENFAKTFSFLQEPRHPF